ncbi:MAG: VOC family protein [Thermoleophilia bacterium]|nr:VOC family protein [Thermoleophilia bacterium]
MDLNHVALTVRDREVAAAFYGRHFGLTRRVHEDAHLLILGGDGGHLLALSEGASPATGLPRTNHFGFRATPDDVRAARRAFAAAGVEETEWQDGHGFVRCQVLDPDGYRVEVYGIA